MATPGHTRVTFIGTFGAAASPVESWSFRLNFRPPSLSSNLQAIAGHAADSWLSRLAPIQPTNVILRQVKCAQIGDDGKYVTDPGIVEPGQAGTQPGSLLYPPQVAVVVSLLTNTRGAKGRGRIFLPAPRHPIIGNDCLLEVQAQDDIRTRAAGLMSDLNEIAGLGTVVVASSSGVLSDVTSIRVGRALDTMRSRRRNLGEAYGGANAFFPSNN
jgi:hypothetical protein